MLYEIATFISATAAFFLAISVRNLQGKVDVLRKENLKLRTQIDGDYQSALEEEVKRLLQSSSDIEVIKFLRSEKGFSLLEAKQLVDSLK
ncbi:ribosomal protein L7/L12 [Croceifilum oryzae]|uniref:Ribosomal protein L7/L12 n=1 Tax=Croceifilum oryzae TaxID=1553429 RepID=A0AAJ1TG81_9BACL|nr:hypothetical protein [Croceifilum oryzae]MDQ0417944.1 ribosomal protein L7/L12 [Croceifilum oryzae]